MSKPSLSRIWDRGIRECRHRTPDRGSGSDRSGDIRSGLRLARALEDGAPAPARSMRGVPHRERASDPESDRSLQFADVGRAVRGGGGGDSHRRRIDPRGENRPDCGKNIPGDASCEVACGPGDLDFTSRLRWARRSFSSPSGPSLVETAGRPSRSDASAMGTNENHGRCG